MKFKSFLPILWNVSWNPWFLHLSQVYHDLLRSEEEFVAELRTCVDNYVRLLDDINVPPQIVANKEKIALNVTELYNFHAK